MRRVLIPQQTAPALPCAGSAVFDFCGETMGTSWTVKLAALPASTPNWRAELQQGIQHELDAVVRQMSHWLADSDLGRFNRAEAGCWQTLPEAFYEVLSYALSVAAISGGAYDPATGALVNLWGFGPSDRYDEPGFCPPDHEHVQSARTRSGCQHLQIDHEQRRIRQPGGLSLDLSAVAKGYGVDRVAQYLERCGLRHYLVEVGGELRGAGVKPDHMPWWVALETPPLLNGEVLFNWQADASHEPTAGGTASLQQQLPPETIVALHGLSIATSGDYRRFYRADTKGAAGPAHCSHTIDPRTGYPIRNDVASVTVLHPSCMAADALSTALTVLGVEDGMAFAEERRLAARFLVRKNRNSSGRPVSAPDFSAPMFSEYMSPAFEAMLQ